MSQPTRLSCTSNLWVRFFFPFDRDGRFDPRGFVQYIDAYLLRNAVASALLNLPLWVLTPRGWWLSTDVHWQMVCGVLPSIPFSIMFWICLLAKLDPIVRKPPSGPRR